MLLCILVTAVLCLLVSLALRNRDFSLQAARVLDHVFRESLEGAAPPPKLPAVSRTRRPYLSAVTKKAVAAAQKWKCNACGRLLDGSFEIDHRVPLSHGGDNSIENLQALHRLCHMAKSATDAQA